MGPGNSGLSVLSLLSLPGTLLAEPQSEPAQVHGLRACGIDGHGLSLPGVPLMPSP